MAADLTFTGDLDTSLIERRLKALSGIKIDLGGGANGGFGRLNQDISQFDRTLDNATKRVLAFGTSLAVFGSISLAMRNLVKDTIEVQKSMIDIGNLLKTTPQQLQQFSAALFSIAGQTGQTFKQVADGAAILAKQGLTTSETLKRLNDAMILARLGGENVKESIATLTGVMNSFNREALTSGEIMNKLVAITSNYAISQEDLTEALKGVSVAAQGAGVNFDQLNALITAAQVKTQAGGSTIRTALKQIFEKVQSGELIQQLREFNIQVSDSQNAVQVLQSVAEKFAQLSKPQQVKLGDMLGGIRQTNQLQALLQDLNSTYGVYNQALKTSASATDEATKRNEALNQSFEAIHNQLSQNLGQLFSDLGKSTFLTPLTHLVQYLNSAVEGFDNLTKSSNFFQGVLKGIENILSGPGLVIAGKVLLEVFGRTTKLAFEGFENFVLTNNKAKELAGIQSQINSLLANASSERLKELELADGLVAREEILLKIYTEQNALIAENASMSAGLAGTATGRMVAGFAAPMMGVQGAVTRERDALVQRGYSPNFANNAIFVGSDPRVGVAVGNRIDEPSGTISEGVNRALSQGLNPQTHGIPNFALSSTQKNIAQSLQQELSDAMSSGDLNKIQEVYQKVSAITGRMHSTYNKKSFSKIAIQGGQDLFYGGGIPESITSSPEEIISPLYTPIAATEDSAFIKSIKSKRQKERESIDDIQYGAKIGQNPKGGMSVSQKVNELRAQQREKAIMNKISSGQIVSDDEGIFITERGQKAFINKNFKGMSESEVRDNKGAQSLIGEYTNNSNEQLERIHEIARRENAIKDIEKRFAEKELENSRGFFGKIKNNFFGNDALMMQKKNAYLGIGETERAANIEAQTLAAGAGRKQIQGFAASIGFSLAGGMAEQYGHPIFGSAFQGASTGAAIGSLVGAPWLGAGIGGAVGGIGGLLSNSNSSPEELNKSLQELSGKFSDSAKSANAYLDAQSNLNDLLDSGHYKLSDVNKLMAQLNESMKGIADPALRQKFIDNRDNPEILQETLSQYNDEKQTQLGRESLATLAATLRTKDSPLGYLNLTHGGLDSSQGIDQLASTIAENSTLFKNGKLDEKGFDEFKKKLFSMNSSNLKIGDISGLLQANGVPQEQIGKLLEQYSSNNPLGGTDIGKDLIPLLAALRDSVTKIQDKATSNEMGQANIDFMKEGADFQLNLTSLRDATNVLNKSKFQSDIAGQKTGLMGEEFTNELSRKLGIGTPQQQIENLLGTTQKGLNINLQEQTRDIDEKARKDFQSFLRDKLIGTNGQKLQSAMVGDYDINSIYNQARKSLTPDNQTQLDILMGQYQSEIQQSKAGNSQEQLKAQLSALGEQASAQLQNQNAFGGINANPKTTKDYQAQMSAAQRNLQQYRQYSQYLGVGINPNNQSHIVSVAERTALEAQQQKFGKAALTSIDQIAKSSGQTVASVTAGLNIQPYEISDIQDKSNQLNISNVLNNPNSVIKDINKRVGLINIGNGRTKAQDEAFRLSQDIRNQIQDANKGYGVSQTDQAAIVQQVLHAHLKDTAIGGIVGDELRLIPSESNLPHNSSQILGVFQEQAKNLTDKANLGNEGGNSQNAALKAAQYLAVQQYIEKTNNAHNQPIIDQITALQKEEANKFGVYQTNGGFIDKNGQQIKSLPVGAQEINKKIIEKSSQLVNPLYRSQYTTQEGMDEAANNATNKGSGDVTNSDANKEINVKQDITIPPVTVIGLNDKTAQELTQGLQDLIRRVFNIEQKVDKSKGNTIDTPPSTAMLA